MVAGTMEKPLGRKKTPPEEMVEKTTTKIAADLNRMAKIIAAVEGGEVFDLLDNILRPVLTARYAQALKQEAARQKELGK